MCIRDRPYSDHVFHQYTVSIDANKASFTRDDLAHTLKAFGVETGMHYPVPIYAQPCFEGRFLSLIHICATERSSFTFSALDIASTVFSSSKAST